MQPDAGMCATELVKPSGRMGRWAPLWWDEKARESEWARGKAVRSGKWPD